MSRRIRLAARITHVVHPDRAVEFNVVGLDLLGDGVDLEDVYAADGERDEVEAPAPEDLGAEVEDVHGINAGHGGHIWQTADEFLFGIECAELWEERKISNGFIGIGILAVVATYLGIGQPVNALGAVCIVVCEDVVGESSLLMKVEAGRAELDVVMDELVGLVVGDTLRWGFASSFEAAPGFHRVGEGHAGHGRRDDEGEETHD